MGNRERYIKYFQKIRDLGEKLAIELKEKALISYVPVEFDNACMIMYDKYLEDTRKIEDMGRGSTSIAHRLLGLTHVCEEEAAYALNYARIMALFKLFQQHPPEMDDHSLEENIINRASFMAAEEHGFSGHAYRPTGQRLVQRVTHEVNLLLGYDIRKLRGYVENHFSQPENCRKFQILYALLKNGS